MEEDRHLVALLPFRQRLACTMIVPMCNASLDRLRPSGTVIAANSHAKRGWVHAPGPPRLALGCAAPGLT